MIKTYSEEVKKVDTLACSGHRCKSVSSHLHIVESKVLEKVKEKIENYTYFLDNYAEEYTKKITTAKKERENIDKRIAMIEKQLKNAKIAFEQEADTLQEYIERKKELNAELDQLLEKKATSVEAVEEERTITIKKAVPKLEKVFKDYHTLEPSEKNDLLKTILESVMYHKEVKLSEPTLDICWII